MPQPDASRLSRLSRREVDDPQADWDEPHYQRWVIASARANGWHVRVTDQRGRPGWRGQQSDKGWPDLILLRDRVVWIELKAKGGEMRPAQAIVIEFLRRGGAEVHVFDPTQWRELLEVL